jgi:hypothetical protein
MDVHSQGAQRFEAEVLHRLVRDRGLRRYGLFFVTQEGRRLPDGSEDASGYVLDESGRTFFFWLGWDAHHGPTFTQWEQVEPEPAWMESAEYRRARDQVRLPN